MIGDYVRAVRAAHQRVRAAEAAMVDDITDRKAGGAPLVEDDRYDRINDEARAAVDARRRAVLGRGGRNRLRDEGQRDDRVRWSGPDPTGGREQR